MTSALQIGLFSPIWFDPFYEVHREVLSAAGPNRVAFEADSWNRASKSAVGVR